MVAVDRREFVTMSSLERALAAMLVFAEVASVEKRPLRADSASENVEDAK